MTIGIRLKQERERVDLSLAELAKTVGIEEREQLKFENDFRYPCAAYLRAVSIYNDMDVNYICTGTRRDGGHRDVFEIRNKLNALENSVRGMQNILEK